MKRFVFLSLKVLLFVFSIHAQDAEYLIYEYKEHQDKVNTWLSMHRQAGWLQVEKIKALWCV